ncbi:MAG: 3'-5' exoribonuclease YhaM family protein [Thermodesulfobacteriota bacterium]
MESPPFMRIRDIQDGQQVEGLFLVKEMSRGETKAGKPYLSLTLMDTSGELSAKVWENADRFAPECPAGAVVEVRGLAQAYKGVLQLRVDGLARLAEEQVDMSRFVPSAPGDVQAMAKELLQLAASIKDPHLRALLDSFFSDQALLEAMRRAPAAKAMHHAYLGGLLEHTLAVARLADRVCGLYPELDRSLLLAGAMLHDIGKLKEFDFTSFPFDYTDQGRLLGHMTLGVAMIQKRLAALPGFPPELAARLCHLILSHHGRHEYGSPVLPMMSEAFVLHFLDDLDAKVNYLSRLAGQARAEGYQWSEYQRNLERFLYLRGNGEESVAMPEEPGCGVGTAAEGARQRSLFGE